HFVLPLFHSVLPCRLLHRPLFLTCLNPESDLARAASPTSNYPPSVGGELALGSYVLEDRQFELECFASAVPHLAAMLLVPEGDPDALDIMTPRSYAEAISGQ
ncbi:unnamed protein product, partial [Closterium sp. NIES-53]